MTQIAFNGQTKIEIAVARIKQFEPQEGYWLAFSGGKDSVVLLSLVIKANVAFEAHYSLTTIDPPELVQFIKTFSQVTIDKPTKSFHQLIQYHGLPRRQGRWCCEELKERGGSGRIVLTGIRAQESSRRAKRKMVETCYTDTSKRFVHPIIDWTTGEVWDYIRSYQLSYCSLYDEGFDRLGCVLCPMTRDVPRQMARFPKTCEAIKHSAYRYWERQTKGGQRFKSPEAMWLWWLNRDGHITPDSQQMMFD